MQKSAIRHPSAVVLFASFHAIFSLMTITQTVEIPVSHRLTIDVPPEVPAGQAKILFFPVSIGKEQIQRSEAEARDIEIINKNAERLNAEAMDVLSYQNMYLDL